MFIKICYLPLTACLGVVSWKHRPLGFCVCVGCRFTAFWDLVSDWSREWMTTEVSGVWWTRTLNCTGKRERSVKLTNENWFHSTSKLRIERSGRGQVRVEIYSICPWIHRQPATSRMVVYKLPYVLHMLIPLEGRPEKNLRWGRQWGPEPRTGGFLVLIQLLNLLKATIWYVKINYLPKH